MTQLKRLKNYPMIAIVLAVLLSLLLAVIIYFAIFNIRPAAVPEDSKLNDERSISTFIIKENQSADNNLLVPTDSKDISAQSSKPQDKEIIKNPPLVKQAADPTNNNTKVRTETVDNRQQNQPEHKLKQTKEYQQLDTDIDKDSERLAELIDEVKKRNQSQIQQHQLPQPNTSDTDTNDIVPIPQAEYDYPITPITALPTADNSKTTTGSAQIDR